MNIYTAPVTPVVATTPVTQPVVQAAPVKTLESEIDRLTTKYEVNKDLVKRIIKCESELYPKAINENIDKYGNVWSRDHGPMQINDYWHKAKMQEMALNIYNWEDSLEYGIVLLKSEGTKPWKASRHCWDVDFGG